MIWLQFVWIITLAGAVICYASQNIFRFSFSTHISNISLDYRSKAEVAVMAVVINKYRNHETAPDANTIASEYGFPISLAAGILEDLLEAGFVAKVFVDKREQEFGFMPTADTNTLTVRDLLAKMSSRGTSDFIPGFEEHFSEIAAAVDKIKDVQNVKDEKIIADIIIK